MTSFFNDGRHLLSHSTTGLPFFKSGATLAQVAIFFPKTSIFSIHFAQLSAHLPPFSVFLFLFCSTELAGKLMVANTKLADIAAGKLSDSFTGKGTAIAEGGDFAANTNIVLGVSTGTLVIQIDVNGDGKFVAEDDYQVSIVGATANSTLAYVAASGDFTLTSA